LETGKWTYKPASVNASCLPKKMWIGKLLDRDFNGQDNLKR
jgi:hypothetical protein